VEVLRLVHSSESLRPVLAHLAKKSTDGETVLRHKLAAWIARLVDAGLLTLQPTR
jgi:hypothetical protein